MLLLLLLLRLLVSGLVSVELKVCSAQFWQARVTETKGLIEERYQQIGRTFAGMMLLICKVGKNGSEAWHALQLDGAQLGVVTSARECVKHMAPSLGLKTVLCLLLSIILNSTHRMVSCIQEGSLLTGTSRLCMRATFLAISALSSTDLISTQLML